MKAKLKELTSRSNGWGYAKRKQKLEEYIRGWVGFYHLANMKRFLMETDEWLRRRLRMCIWKSWKRVKTRIANLIKCGIDKYQAYMWGNSRLGYWRIAGSYILEIDFVVNRHDERLYIQSANALPDKEKVDQEQASLLNVNDGFRKLIIVGDRCRSGYNEEGILMMSLSDFLLGKE